MAARMLLVMILLTTASINKTTTPSLTDEQIEVYEALFNAESRINDLTEELEAVKSQLAKVTHKQTLAEDGATSIQGIYKSLVDMCHTLLHDTGGCKREEEKQNSDEVQEDTEPRDFRFLRVSSSQNEDGGIDITTEYTSMEEHSAFWTYWAHQGNNAYVFKAAESEKTGKTKNSGNIWKTSVTTYWPEIINVPRYRTGLRLQLFAKDTSAILEFNVDALKTDITEFLPPLSVRFSLNRKLYAPLDGNLSVPIFTKDGAELTSGDGYVLVLNTSLSPPLAEKVRAESGLLYANFTPKGQNAIIELILENDLVKYGGFLEIAGCKSPNKTLVSLMCSSSDSYIYPFNKSSPFPNDMAAFESLGSDSSTIIAESKEVSIACLAYGNPSPKITIRKANRRGKMKKLVSSNLSFMKYQGFAVHTISHLSRDSEGTYICRARSGSFVTEKEFNLIIPEKIKFKENKSGLTANTSTHFEITCVATGKPMPRLRSSISGDEFENVVEFISEDQITSTVSLVATMHPVDVSIRQVTCTAFNDVDWKEFQIEVYPKQLPVANTHRTPDARQLPGI